MKLTTRLYVVVSVLPVDGSVTVRVMGIGVELDWFGAGVTVTVPMPELGSMEPTTRLAFGTTVVFPELAVTASVFGALPTPEWTTNDRVVLLFSSTFGVVVLFGTIVGKPGCAVNAT